MKPLIITGTPNVSWLHPNVWCPKSAGEIADEAAACVKVWASIVHVHAEKWKEAIRAVRKKIDGILQWACPACPCRTGWKSSKREPM